MKSGESKRTFTDKLIEIAEVVPVHIGRFFNDAFRLVLGGTAIQRMLRQLQPTVEAINALEPQLQKLSDKALSAKTEEFRNRLADGATLDDLLVEAFAVVREAARRLEGHPYPKRHYDVQLLGGIVLHQGKIAEMVTGEGKTLVATLPAYLNALTGKGVHIITVNDYLARRDAAWMGPVYEFLGLTVGAIQSEMDPDMRKPIYACDIVYGTNHEFGFDYLRDNMRIRVEDQVQRELNYAILDEVDNILIDEARTPLIISGMPEGTTEKYYIANRAAQRLKKGVHYEVKEKERAVVLTEEGILAAQKLVGVTSFYTGKNVDWPHYIDNALQAKELFERDRRYVVKDGEVIIVDEFTGRLMPGRRWSNGLHQAIEAKEGLRVQEENQTLATITYQNFFRLYKKLAGMTGTALTEAAEFAKIYNLEVVPIPPNKPLRRVSYPDVIYATDAEKVDAIIEEIAEVHATGRPVLVGTVSVERSEMLSERLQRRGIPHVVLNAKYHKKESAIVAQAGEPGAVTIATNMAGRGTDIVLGGNPTLQLQAELELQWKKTETEAKDLINVFRNARRLAAEKPPAPVELVLPGLRPGQRAHWDPALSAGENIHRIAAAMGIEMSPEDAEKLLARLGELEAKAEAAHDKVVALGGLHIIGTERHEARRIDNQLRGRAGRQGDPGSSRFFLSLEDDLMRIFMGEWVRGFMRKAGLRDGQAIEAGMVTRAIERAQRKVEEMNFGMRKHVLEYDEVMNEQRKLVYGERQAVLEAFRERPPEVVASEVISEFIQPEWLEGEGVELRRSFQLAAAAVRAACGVDASEADWRRLGFQGFCERAAEAASGMRPDRDEIEAAATRAIAEALGEFESRERWSSFPQMRVKELGFTIERPWHEVFAEILSAKLAEAVEPAATAAIIRDWVHRGVIADLPLLPSRKWDYDGFLAWRGELPCNISGAEWGPLLGRPENIEPLVVERLTEGFGSQSIGSIISALVRRGTELYLRSDVFRRRPSPERISCWAEYRFGIRISPAELEDLAAEALSLVARAAAEAKATQLDEPDGFALFWHYPSIAAAVRRTLAAEGRDFVGLCRRIEQDFAVRLDPFDLSKLGGEALRKAVADALAASPLPCISCRGLDEIVTRTFQSVIDHAIEEYVQDDAVPAERNYAPLKAWADGLGLHFSRDDWLAASRDELGAMLSAQVRDLADGDARDFARRCTESSIKDFLAGESFAEDPSYERLAAWAFGRFRFSAASSKIETALSRAVDERRNNLKKQLITDIQKNIEAEGREPQEAIGLLFAAALRAYFTANVVAEEISLEPLARWINSKLHVSIPAAQMQELMDIDERTITALVCERARQALARQKLDRIVADVVNASIDCFLPPETFPAAWAAAEFEQWLKRSGLGVEPDVQKLMEDVDEAILEILVETAMAGYGERPAGIVAADTVRHAFDTFLDSDLAAAGRNFVGLAAKMNRKFRLNLDPFELSKLDVESLRKLMERLAFEALERRAAEIGRRQLHWIARVLILQAIDTRWKDHLAVMEGLQSGIGLRGYAQIDPKIAYKKEGYEAFEAMIAAIQEEVSDMLLRAQIELGTEVQEERGDLHLVHSNASAYRAQMDRAITGSGQSERGRVPVRAQREPGRNDPCSCGSGKKYKNCCMGKR